jgi:hypothetical protein
VKKRIVVGGHGSRFKEEPHHSVQRVAHHADPIPVVISTGGHHATVKATVVSSGHHEGGGSDSFAPINSHGNGHNDTGVLDQSAYNSRLSEIRNKSSVRKKITAKTVPYDTDQH